MTLTSKQFELLATKQDLRDLRDEMMEKMATKKDFNVLLNAVDGLAKNVKDFQVELTANQGAHNRFSRSISSLNRRVKVLETK